MVLTTKQKSGRAGIVVLTQHQPVRSLFDNAACAAQPGMGLRRKQTVVRKISRDELVTRKITAVERHLYLTR